MGLASFRAPGVEPVFLDKDQAIGYAETRAQLLPERYAFSIRPAMLSA